MFKRTRRLVASTSAALAGAVVLGTLVVSLGVAVPSSSAGESAFCTTLFTFVEKYEVKYAAPKGLTTADYKEWAKELLPFYEQLASDAPNAASKTELNYVVVILKYYTSVKSLTSLEGYIAANHVKFEEGTKALAKAIKGCA